MARIMHDGMSNGAIENRRKHLASADVWPGQETYREEVLTLQPLPLPRPGQANVLYQSLSFRVP